MILTNKELQELAYLGGLKSNRNIPMIQKDHDRYRFLNIKLFHNCCSNIFCPGYEASDNETICPKCGSKIYKLI